MQKYTKTKVIRITDLQHKTLQKMKTLNVDVGNFIRIAIQEKLERDKHEILKSKAESCPF
jgi:hypothetical protein